MPVLRATLTGDEHRLDYAQVLVLCQHRDSHGSIACCRPDRCCGETTSVHTDAAEGGGAPAERAWEEALELLQGDLARRDAAARTRRAYAVDLAQFARWARAHGLEPADVGPKEVRRYVAHLSEAGAAASTSARKLAALRALFASLREHGHISHNPGDLVSTPRRPAHLPRVLSARDAARLLDGIPAGSPLELRDRALLELAYACGLRAEEL